MDVLLTAKKAKEAARAALKLDTELKNRALETAAEAIESAKKSIFEANAADLKAAEKNGLEPALMNRLKLDDNKMRDMVQGIRDIKALDDPVNKIFWSKEISEGITLKKVSCPIGVIGFIFEARPDVICQMSALCIKASDAVIMKGGIEASETNKTIFGIIQNTLKEINEFPDNMINLLYSREEVTQMLKLDEYIDLIIPRGSNSFVKYIKENTKIPVLGHADGVCHIYAAETADFNKACDIIIDAKCQYPAACNAAETVLVNEKIKDRFIPMLFERLKREGVIINADAGLKKDYPEYVNGIVSNWHTEYGNKTVSVKIVKDTQDAIEHINKYGSGHTDCIITDDDKEAEDFMTFVDSAGVYKNISTRFADGFRYGFGAEAGIAANKIHARGPAGLEAMTIYKYKLYGNGDIVKDFIEGKRQFNNHK